MLASSSGSMTSPQYRHQQQRETVQAGAKLRDQDADDESAADERKPLRHAEQCDIVRHSATICDTPAGVTQLVECQPSKLNVEGSTPFARLKHKPPQVQYLRGFFAFGNRSNSAEIRKVRHKVRHFSGSAHLKGYRLCK